VAVVAVNKGVEEVVAVDMEVLVSIVVMVMVVVVQNKVLEDMDIRYMCHKDLLQP